MNVKIIGAGSIGNHMAQASRRMGWEVVVVDTDPKALERMKNEIYPKRYGSWDKTIQLFTSAEEPKGSFDIIVIGTPPDTHMSLALAAIQESPTLLHIEKPLCTPSLDGVEEFIREINRRRNTIVTVGYDHAVAESVEAVSEMLKQETFGEIIAMDVEFRQHWQGIFQVHPWLAGPWESYLGYWERGGGAGGEHSHALHLWLHFAEVLQWGKVSGVKAMFDTVEENGASYDRVASFNLRTDKGKVGRVVQDVITLPERRWARLQGKKGFVEWYCSGVPEGDFVRYQIEGQDVVEKVFPKRRPDDFYRETLHYEKLLSGQIRPDDSPLSFERGLNVMEVLHNAHSLS